MYRPKIRWLSHNPPKQTHSFKLGALTSNFEIGSKQKLFAYVRSILFKQ